MEGRAAGIRTEQSEIIAITERDGVMVDDFAEYDYAGYGVSGHALMEEASPVAGSGALEQIS